MRLIGWWGMVFAVILASLVGALAYLRHDARPHYWLFFTVEENLQHDVYRLNPATGQLKNISQTPTRNEVILFAHPAEPTLLMVSNERVPGGQKTYQHLFANGSHPVSYNIPTEIGYPTYNNWSTQGQLLFSIQDSEGVTTSMGIAEADGTIIPLTQPPPPCTPDTPHAILQAYEPSWSPDGEWIYYTVQFCDASLVTYRMRPDGSDQHQVLDWRTQIYWTPDGEWVLVYLYYNGGFTLFRARPDGSEQAQLTENYYEILSITSDWVYLRDYTSGVYRMKSDGSDFEQLVDNVAEGSRVLWTADWLYFIGYAENDDFYLYRLNLKTLHREQIATGDVTPDFLLTISPDTRWLFMEGYDPNTHTDPYQFATDGATRKRYDISLDFEKEFFWLPHPNLPWHPPSFVIGACALVIGCLYLQKRIV